MSTFSFYSMQKSTYLWLTDQTSDVYDLIDWAFDCILDEEISGIQGWYNTGRLLGKHRHRRQESSNVTKPPLL